MITTEPPGDLLLHALTAWGEASAAELRRVLDQLSPPAPASSDPGLARHTRAAALRALQSLGHCEPTDTGGLRVKPLRLAELPAAGEPQAFLCGARSRATSAAAAAAATAAGARLEQRPQPLRLAPTRLLVTAPSRSALQQIADTLGAGHDTTPAAWKVLSDDTATVATYQHQLRWEDTPELNWPRRDFDTVSCVFTAPAAADPGPYRLSAYLNPTTQQPRHALWKGPRVADADRDWGRYLALYRRRLKVFRYAPEGRTAWAPTTAPLPAALAAALTQCSGLLPERIIDDPGIGRVHRWDQYQGIPPAISTEVTSRLEPGR